MARLLRLTEDVSFAEEQLWLAAQPDARPFPFFDCAPSLSLVARLENALNLQAVKASLDHIVRRHEVLRSCFVAYEGRPVRRLGRTAAAHLTTVDLRRHHGTRRAARLQRVLDRHVRRPFDLTRGPLFRALVVVLANDEHVLAITAHHIVFDRWSKRVLVRELKLLYQAYATGETPSLEPLSSAYGDYVRWQRHGIAPAADRELTTYWTTKLRGLADDPPWGDGDGAETGSFCAGRWRFTIPAADASRLAAMSRRFRTTPPTTMLAIFKLLLNRATGGDDIAVGMPLSDRRRPEFEPLIGLFANVVVVRTAVSARMTFVELVESVRRSLVDACRFQDLPYGRLVQVLGTRTPLYRVVYNFLPRIAESHVELEGLRTIPLDVPTERQSRADLTLHVCADSGELDCRLVYRTAILSLRQVQTFAARMQDLVRAVLDEPLKPVGSYALAPDVSADFSVVHTGGRA